MLTIDTIAARPLARGTLPGRDVARCCRTAAYDICPLVTRAIGVALVRARLVELGLQPQI